MQRSNELYNKVPMIPQLLRYPDAIEAANVVLNGKLRWLGFASGSCVEITPRPVEGFQIAVNDFDPYNYAPPTGQLYYLIYHSKLSGFPHTIISHELKNGVITTIKTYDIQVIETDLSKEVADIIEKCWTIGSTLGILPNNS
jgi:hypothetical protein